MCEMVVVFDTRFTNCYNPTLCRNSGKFKCIGRIFEQYQTYLNQFILKKIID